jgi:hypothetical protein
MSLIGSQDTGLGSFDTGAQSVNTADSGEGGSCPECPLFPPHTNLPLWNREYRIFKVIGDDTGGAGLAAAQNNIMCKVIATILSADPGTWECVRSCDGTTVAVGENLLTDYTKIKTLLNNGVNSWITLRNKVFGTQIQLTATVNGGNAEWARDCSPAVGFTGGGTTSFPTASDSYEVCNPVAFDWLGVLPAGNPRFRAIVWLSVDGMCTRVVWYYNSLAIAWWQWDAVQFPCGGDWVKFLTCDKDGGNDYTACQPVIAKFYQQNSSSKVRGPNGAEDFYFPLFGNYGGGLTIEEWPKNLTTGQYNWQGPPVMTSTTGPTIGPLGYLTDMWFTGVNPAGSDTAIFKFGDTADNRRIFMNASMMLPWDGSDPADAGIVGSTDYPDSDFFGQTTT